MMKRSSWALLLATCVLYLGIRIHWLLGAFDHLVFPMYELYPPGVLGRIFQLGLDQPIGLHYDNSGGSLINGFLAVPFFEVLGPSYMAYKMVPLLLGFLLLICGFFWVRGLLGERAALAAAFLLAMGPTELLQKYSLIGTGNHFENLLYMALTLWAFDAAHRSGCTPRRLFLMGLAAGVNLFVILAAVIPVGCMVGLHVMVRGLRGSLRDLRFAGPGFALGLAPLILMNLYVSPRGLHFLTAKFAEDSNGGGAGLGSRFWTFLTKDMQQAPFHGDTHPALGWSLLGLWVVCFLVLGLPLIRHGTRHLRGMMGTRSPDESGVIYERLKLLPLVFWTPLAALAFALSNLANGKHAYPLEVGGYRYFLPHFYLLSVMAVALLVRPGWNLRAKLGLALVAVIGMLGLQPLREVPAGGQFTSVGWHYEGFSFVQHARAFVMHSSGVSRSEAIDWANELPDLDARRMHRGLGYYHAQLSMMGDADGDGQVDPEERERFKVLPKNVPRLDLEVLLKGVPQEYQMDWCRGAGAGLRTLAGYKGNEAGAIRDMLVRIAQGGDARVVHLVEGACWKQAYEPLTRRVPHLVNRAAEVAAALHGADFGEEQDADGLRDAAGRSLGILIGRLMAREYEPEVEVLKRLFNGQIGTYRRSLLEGIGIGLVDNRTELGWPTLTMDRIVQVDAQGVVAAAFGAECRRVSRTQFLQAFKLVPPELQGFIEDESP